VNIYPPRVIGSQQHVAARNEITEAKLQRLARLRANGPRVLSVYLDLDPERFATPPARASEVDSLLGYRSPMRGPAPQVTLAANRTQELALLTERICSWLADGIELNAIGVSARSAALVREARTALEAAGIATADGM